MKKVIKSFWVTAGESCIDLVLRTTDKILLYSKFILSDICVSDNLPNYI